MQKSILLKLPLFIAIFSIIILIMHYSNIDFDINTMFNLKNINEIMIDLNNAVEENNLLKLEISDSENKIKNIKKNLDEMLVKNVAIYSNLDNLKIICGKTDVRGPGITIRVADNLSDENDEYNINYKIVHDFDVRIIINQLNKAGAEAIAINGKRIINTTEVICIGPVIRVNGEAVAAPFIIKAIGNPDTLMELVIDSPEAYAYDIKNNYGIDITAIKSYDINISRNKEKIEVEHAKLSEEGE